MDKVTIPSPDELINYWKKGWPGYVVRPVEDYPAILSIARQSAQISGEDLEDERGQQRIKLAVTAIAMYCYNSSEFARKNIRYADMAFPRLVHEMQYAKRSNQLQAQIDSFIDYYDRDKKQHEENQRLSRECSERARKFIEENWTDELEADYQRWKANGYKIPNLSAK